LQPEEEFKTIVVKVGKLSYPVVVVINGSKRINNKSTAQATALCHDRGRGRMNFRREKDGC